ncbi:MAG TPA: C2 family cysteine protease [Terracidiphilus sp.]|jgi:hypothetical protein
MIPGVNGRSRFLHPVAWATMASIAAAATAQAPAPPSTPLYGPHGISALAVRQGYLGTCYFHASLSSLANAHPEAIRNAIRQDQTGNFHVKFVDGKEEVVSEDDVSFAEIHRFDRSEGEWVSVLMRAYAQRLLRESLSKAIDKSEQVPTFLKPTAHSTLESSDLVLQAYDRAVRVVINQNGTIDKAALQARLDQEGKTLGVPAAGIQLVKGFLEDNGIFDTLATAIQQNGEFFGAYRSFGQGGIPSRVFQAFVGAGHVDFPKNHDRVLAQMRKVQAGGLAMVADSGTNPPAGSANWWVASHAYSVLGLDEARQTITVRNPWGEHPDPDGTFTIPLSVFFDSFTIYSFSSPDTQ